MLHTAQKSLAVGAVGVVVTLFAGSILFLWNLNLGRAFGRWWAENGGEFERWLRAIGRVEEICSFASLLHDNVGWTFPNFISCDRILGQALGHPMIPVRARVDNDAELGPPGRILMVTGSNMSGKTTLLRSIGTNVLLAKAGGPVCAKKFELPWVEVVTSTGGRDASSRRFWYGEYAAMNAQSSGLSGSPYSAIQDAPASSRW